ncbi:hypothetical protein RCL1_004016 [Eukaryota sp. TZLM3-RCL]
MVLFLSFLASTDHATFLLMGLGVICLPFAVVLTLSQRSYFVENRRQCQINDVIFFLFSAIPIIVVSLFCFYHGSNVADHIRFFVACSVSAFMWSLMIPFFQVKYSVLSAGVLYGIAVSFGVLLLAISPPPIPVSPNPLISLLDAHTLKDFDLLVVTPQVSVDIDILTEISSFNTRKVLVIAGQPGCGKSVSLFSYLKDKHVLWVSGRNLPCKNLARLGLNVTTYTEEHCLFLMDDALMTNNYTLVIDDVQVLDANALLTRLFRGHGSAQSVPFPVYFTVSDYNAFTDNIKPLIRRIYSPHFYYYPSDDVIGDLTSKLNLNFTKTMMDVGPSLRLIQDYATDSREVSSLCEDIVEELKALDQSAVDLLFNVTPFISSDRGFVHLSDVVSSETLQRLSELNYLTAGKGKVFFHNPLVRRAACTFFKHSHNWESVRHGCESVSLCSDIVADF